LVVVDRCSEEGLCPPSTTPVGQMRPLSSRNLVKTLVDVKRLKFVNLSLSISNGQSANCYLLITRLEALEALRNALYKCSTYLLTYLLTYLQDKTVTYNMVTIDRVGGVTAVHPVYCINCDL